MRGAKPAVGASYRAVGAALANVCAVPAGHEPGRSTTPSVMWLPDCVLNVGRGEVRQNGEAVQTSGGGPRSGPDPLVYIN